MKGHDHGPSAGYAPGANPIAAKLLGLLTGNRGTGKKRSGRTPLEPKTARAAHHLHRWRDEGRQALVLEALRLAVLVTNRPYVGRRPWAQFSTWKSLAVAVERARRAPDS